MAQSTKALRAQGPSPTDGDGLDFLDPAEIGLKALPRRAARRVVLPVSSASRRLVAGVFDLAPVIAVTLWLWSLGVGDLGALVPAEIAFWPEHLGDLYRRAPFAFVRPLLIPALLAPLVVGVQSVLFGRSLGKRIMGLSVVGPDGVAADPTRQLVRVLAYLVSVLTLGVGWLLAPILPSRRTLHDVLSGTWTVRAR